jgi:predicted patatin/cPLA2 family phospholipase
MTIASHPITGSLPPLRTTGQPVIDVIIERACSQSLPGHRTDSARVALVIEGGGMRGVISAGMVTALEQLGLHSTVDAVFGTSAGANAGAYFISRQAALGTSIYYEDLIDQRFIDFKRIPRRGKSLVSLDHLLDDVMARVKPLDYASVLASPIPLHVVATHVPDYRPVVLSGFVDADELRDALRATAQIPLAAGPPVPFRGDLYVDGSVTQSIPLASALSLGFTHILALLTRPAGALRGRPRRFERHVLYPFMNRHTPGLGTAHLPRSANYARELAHLAQLADTTQESAPYASLMQLPSSTPGTAQLEQDPAVLFARAAAGAATVYEAFTGSAPRFFRSLTPRVLRGGDLAP